MWMDYIVRCWSSTKVHFSVKVWIALDYIEKANLLTITSQFSPVKSEFTIRDSKPVWPVGFINWAEFIRMDLGDETLELANKRNMVSQWNNYCLQKWKIDNNRINTYFERKPLNVWISFEWLNSFSKSILYEKWFFIWK